MPASTCPSVRPASRTSWTASGRPAAGQGQTSLVDDLARAGEKLLVAPGGVAAEHHDGGVEHVDEARDHLPERPAGVADGLDGLGPAGAHVAHDVEAGVRLEPRL